MRLTKQQLIDRFTPAEMAGVLAAAKTNETVEAWLFRFNNVTPDPDGTSIDTEDARTIAGLQAFEVVGLLAAGRASEILASQPTAVIGHVRILPPFDTAYPDVYGIVSDVAGVVTIEAGVEFAPGSYERID